MRANQCIAPFHAQMQPWDDVRWNEPVSKPTRCSKSTHGTERLPLKPITIIEMNRSGSNGSGNGSGNGRNDCVVETVLGLEVRALENTVAKMHAHMRVQERVIVELCRLYETK